jgi:hypothetical protein
MLICEILNWYHDHRRYNKTIIIVTSHHTRLTPQLIRNRGSTKANHQTFSWLRLPKKLEAAPLALGAGGTSEPVLDGVDIEVDMVDVASVDAAELPAISTLVGSLVDEGAAEYGLVVG